MVELLNGRKVSDVTRILLTGYGILVKDLTIKLKGHEYMRIAIRNTEDNNRLAEAIKEIMEG